jgi:hypothetical protein
VTALVPELAVASVVAAETEGAGVATAAQAIRSPVSQKRLSVASRRYGFAITCSPSCELDIERSLTAPELDG